MTKEQMAACFNEWMQRYIDDPDGFQDQFKTAVEFMNSDEPTYGDEQAEYMFSLLADM